MRRYGVLLIFGIVLGLAALRSLPSTPVLAGPLPLVVFSPTPTATATGTTTETATPTGTATQTATSTITGTSTGTATATTTGTTTATSTTTQTPTRTSTPTATPTIGILLPIILRQPTPTPTPTVTQPPTQTSPPYTISTGHLSGLIYWKEGRSQYYMNIEWIKFMWWLHNDSGNTIERYQIAGVNVRWPDGVRNAFHTSWTGGPDYVGSNCYGPNGSTIDWNLHLRCAGDTGSGQNEDHIGASTNIPVDTPGQYTLQLNVCQSPSVSVCQSTSGEWHQLGPDLTMVAVPPPSELHIVAPTPTGDVCHLTMIDATHGRLECAPYKPSSNRPGPQR